MKKTTKGSSVTYETRVKPDNGALPDNFTTVSASGDITAIEKYFSVDGVFSSAVSLAYHHRIDWDTSIVIPTTTWSFTSSNGIYALDGYHVSVATTYPVIIDGTGTLGYTLTVTANEEQLYL